VQGEQISALERQYQDFEQRYLSEQHAPAQEEANLLSALDEQGEALTDKATAASMNAMNAEEKTELEALIKAMESDPSANLYLAIKQLGGIKSFAKGQEAEELRGLPLHLRNNNTGSTLDELVGELRNFGWHFADGTELLERIKDIGRAGMHEGRTTRIRRGPRAIRYAVRLGARVRPPKAKLRLLGAPYESLPPLATPAQIALAHILAKQKGLGPRQFKRMERTYGGGKSTMKGPAYQGEKRRLMEKGMPEPEAERAAKAKAEKLAEMTAKTLDVNADVRLETIRELGNTTVMPVQE